MFEHRRHRSSCWSGALCAAVLIAPSLEAAVRDPFPEPRPVNRAEAIALVASTAPPAAGCLTPKLQRLRETAFAATPAQRRALSLLQQRSEDVEEQVAIAADGIRIRYTTQPGGFGRIAEFDRDGDRRPDLVQAVADGLAQARAVLAERLRLPAPGEIEVLLVELGGGSDGYFSDRPHEGAPATIVLDASPRHGSEAARREAIHQYAHAVALAAGLRGSPEWAEALATWSVLAVDGRPEAASVRAGLSARLGALREGLFTRDPAQAAGNALWLAFLDEAYGPASLTATVESLAQGLAEPSALDAALRQTSGTDLVAAFREFHLWCVLVGERADRFHFPFARLLSEPAFASTADGLPALSVQADPAVASWGATQVRLIPGAREGGLHVRFEGEFAGRWDADLILVGDRGSLRRVSMAVSTEGRGERTIPVDGVVEVWLLVRHLGGEDDGPRPYSYSAHAEPGYPFELAALEVAPLDDPPGGVVVVWATTSEQELAGFSILRVPEDGGSEEVVNPVWIPALGDLGTETSYQYIDRAAEPGRAYLYRIQGITRDGLSSLSEPVIFRLPRCARP
jgi:hypothetical protein